jgi:hypothetical protein
MFLSFSFCCNLLHYLHCLVLSIEEVANAVRLMFDQSLTDQGSEVPEPFSSDTTPLQS